MGFDINAFTAEISKTGFARPCDFEVEITGGFLNKIRADANPNPIANSLTFRVESTGLPMRSIGSVDYKDYGYPYKIGGLPNVVEVQMMIICSPDLRERDFFMAWQDLIIGDHRKMRRTDSAAQSKKFDIGYYDDYIADKISIYQLDNKGFRTYAVDLMQAYPMQIQEQILNWNTVEIQKLGVTLTYRYFEERNTNLGGQTAQVSEKFGGRPQFHIGLDQLRNPRKYIKASVMRNARSLASKLKKRGIDLNF